MDVLPTKLWAGAAAFEEMTHGRAVDDTRSVYVWGLRDAAATMREAKAALAASAARIEAKDAALKEARDLITWHDNRVLLEGSRRVVGIIDAALDAAPRSDGGRDFIAELEAKEPTQALRDLMNPPARAALTPEDRR